MTFTKYRSIENSYQKESLKYFKERVPEGIPFVAMEKIHGSNFNIVVLKNGTFQFYSRDTLLVDWMSFFWYEKLITSELKNNLLNAANSKFEKYKLLNPVSIQFVWELFGGSYPNYNYSDSQKVQKWVFYCPQNDIRFFDTIIHTEDSIAYRNAKDYNPDKPFEDFYLWFEEFLDMCKDFSIKTAPVIKIGTIEDLLAMDIENFESTIYKEYNLEKVEGNIVEWFVIKPFINFYCGKNRVIIKYKTDKFLEQKNKSSLPKEEKVFIPSSDSYFTLIEKFNDYLTENRVESAKSKYPTDNSFIGKIINEFTTDSISDFDKDYKEQINSFSKEDKSVFYKTIWKTATDFIKPFIFGKRR